MILLVLCQSDSKLDCVNDDVFLLVDVNCGYPDNDLGTVTMVIVWTFTTV